MDPDHLVTFAVAVIALHHDHGDSLEMENAGGRGRKPQFLRQSQAEVLVLRVSFKGRLRWLENMCGGNGPAGNAPPILPRIVIEGTLGLRPCQAELPCVVPGAPNAFIPEQQSHAGGDLLIRQPIHLALLRAREVIR